MNYETKIASGKVNNMSTNFRKNFFIVVVQEYIEAMLKLGNVNF